MSAVKLDTSSWGEIEFGSEAGRAPLWGCQGKSCNRPGSVNTQESSVMLPGHPGTQAFKEGHHSAVPIRPGHMKARSIVVI